MFTKFPLKILFPCLTLFRLEGHAAAVNVNPINFQLSQHKKIETLTLTNQGDQPLTVHLQIKEWSQDKGQDVLNKTKDIMVLPNTCVIKPQSRHIIRIVLKTSPHLHIEKSYRLYIVEGTTTDDTLQIQRGLGMRLEMSLPIFVDPLEDKGVKNPHLKIYSQDNKLKLHNAGTQHLHINKIQIPSVKKDSHHIGKYILPNHHYIWEHPSVSRMSKNVEVVAHVNNEVQIINVDSAP